MDKNRNNPGDSDWVDDRLAELTSPAGWEPDTGRALRTLRVRPAASSVSWGWLAMPAAALLALVAFPSLMGRTGFMNPGPAVPPVGGEEALVALVQAERGPAAVFEGDDTLLRPEGYREWVFVGSSLGLSYADIPDPANRREDDLFHNVYIDPSAYRTYSESGEFPDGTVMILELARASVKDEPGLQGMYEQEFVALEVSVKDTSRFEGDWAYYGFTERDGGLKDKAEPFDPESCWKCHNEKAETDKVFTQFYPVLRAGLE